MAMIPPQPRTYAQSASGSQWILDPVTNQWERISIPSTPSSAPYEIKQETAGFTPSWIREKPPVPGYIKPYPRPPRGVIGEFLPPPAPTNYFITRDPYTGKVRVFRSEEEATKVFQLEGKIDERGYPTTPRGYARLPKYPTPVLKRKQSYKRKQRKSRTTKNKKHTARKRVV